MSLLEPQVEAYIRGKDTYSLEDTANSEAWIASKDPVEVRE